MLKRMISLILCLAMVLTILPTQTIAQETEEQTETRMETESAVEEDPIAEEPEPIEDETAPVEEETEPMEKEMSMDPSEGEATPSETMPELEQTETNVYMESTGNSVADCDHTVENDICTKCGSFGYCGENLTWIIEADNVLRISGTGAMTDFSDYAPWTSDDTAYTLQTIVLEDGITSIGNHAFDSLVEVSHVEIPGSVQSIGSDAFWGCDSLEEITIPDGVISIADGVFMACDNLQSVELPNSLISIGESAFSGCSSLASIRIPAGVTTISQRIFSNCTALSEIVFQGDAPVFSEKAFTGITVTVSYPANNATWTSDVMQNYGGTITWTSYSDEHVHDFGEDNTCECGVIGGTCGDNLTWMLDAEGTLTLSGFGAMDDYTHYYTSPWLDYQESITSVVINEGVTSIGTYAFFCYDKLLSVEIPNSITSIGYYAFCNCTSLITLDIPDNVTAITEGVFQGCNELTSVTIGSGVTTIDSTVFNECKSLIQITVDENNPNYSSDDWGVLFNKEKTELIHAPCAISGTYSVPKSVTTIGDEAFYNCGNLSNIAIPNNVTDIGEGAFFSCFNLANVNIPDGITTIAPFTFFDCDSLLNVPIPNGITTIGHFAFGECDNLIAVEISDSVTTIDSEAFTHCINLTDVVIGKNTTTIGSYAFYDCTGLSEIRFLCDVPSIEENVFLNVTATAYYPVYNSTWTEEVMQDYGGTLTWVPYGAVENRLMLDAEEFSGHSSVWIDGAEMSIQKDGDSWYIDLPDGNARVMTTYEYVSDGTSEDGVAEHVRYPVSMQVWTLENQGGAYTTTRQTDFDDILQYSGISIRVTGKKGIRMITSIDAASKESLTGAGLAGYTLREYGTAIAWASQLGSSKPLILGKSWVSSNYAYKKDVADPIFRQTNGLMQYTNVLVDFSNEQCADDLAMRPYMILADADGNEITIYGGIVNRSIGYIALRNRNAFLSDTDPYDFLWDIIHSVYGDAYDADWQPSWTDAIL